MNQFGIFEIGGKVVLNLPPLNWLGWILIVLGCATIFLGIFFVILTTRGM